MGSFLNPVIFRLENIFTVLSREISSLNSDNIINMGIVGAISFFIAFFISKWFRAYLLKLLIFISGAWLLWQVSATNNILFNLAFYVGLGMIIPHLEIVEITYLLVRERTLFIYEQLVSLCLIILKPFIFIYDVFIKGFEFIKVKQEEYNYKKAQEQNFYEEFKKQQEEEYKKEQERIDEKYKQEQEKRRKQQEEKKKREQKQSKNSSKNKEENQNTSRWDSTDPYIILGISPTSTKEDIKKAYKKLAKIYHPDLSLLNKAKAEEIFKKINWAYQKLK